MKKSSLTRVASFALAFSLVCGSVVAVPVDADAAAKTKKITLSSAKKTMYVGQSFKLKVKKVTPAKASKAVTYKSDNAAVATVNKKGKVVAKSEGTATITVTSKKNKNATAKCVVTVKKGVENIQTAKKVYLQKGKKLKLNWTVAPTTAENQKVAFKTNKKKVAKVNKKGQITAKKVGKAKITVTAKGGSAKSTVNVVVKKKITKVTGITLDKTALALDKGATAAVKATVAPAKATAKEVYWLSSNQNVATVDANGNITAVADGTATITAYATDFSKVTAACTVTVTTPAQPQVVPPTPVDPPVDDTKVAVDVVKANINDVVLNVGETKDIIATVGPADASDKSLTWTSADSEIASVPAVGTMNEDSTTTNTITAVKEGTTTITVTSVNGVTDTIKVTVNAAGTEKPEPVWATDLTIDVLNRDDDAFSLFVNGRASAVATVEPSDAENKDVMWESDSDAVTVVKTVDKEGNYSALIIGDAVGTATVTARTLTAEDGSYAEDSVDVTVMTDDKSQVIERKDGQTTVKFEDDKTYTFALNVGGREKMITVTPEDIEKAYSAYKKFAAVDNINTFWNKITDDVADTYSKKLTNFLKNQGIEREVEVEVVASEDNVKTVKATAGEYEMTAEVAMLDGDTVVITASAGNVVADEKTVTIDNIDLSSYTKTATVKADNYAVDASWSEDAAAVNYDGTDVVEFSYYNNEFRFTADDASASEVYAKALEEAKTSVEVPDEFKEYIDVVPATYDELVNTVIGSDNFKVSIK